METNLTVESQMAHVHLQASL